MGMFDGKKILVLGVANDKSIAFGITEALAREGAELALTYVNEAIERRVRPIADSIGCKVVLPCDVASDQSITDLMSELESRWGRIDGIVHSVAFADKDDLGNRFSQIPREGFKLALDISAYSFVAVCGKAEPLMRERGGSCITLSYMGAERVIPNYHIMGVAKAALEASVRYLAADLGKSNIRVNAVSAGPLKTLAASGIPRFREMLKMFEDRAPLGRPVTLEDIAGTALYLLGPLGVGVTGEVAHVDCGYNIMGM